MIKKNKPQNEAKITGCFMKKLVLSGEKLGYFVPLIFKKYPAQAALLVDYIVKKLIDETIIDDETLPQKSFIEKIKELSEVGVFEVSTFQDFLKEFLEEYDYSFETAAEASSPSALEDQDSLKQFFEEYQLIFETAAQPWAASVLVEEKRV